MKYDIFFEKELSLVGDFDDCYAFSIHKAGSTLMNTMIGEVCRRGHIPAISIPDRLFKNGIFETDWEKDQNIINLISSGKIYYGFRGLPNVFLTQEFKLKEKKSVLLVRDPRDALVSEYFSYGGKNISHVLPGENAEVFLERLKKYSNWDIDQYVLSAGVSYLNKMLKYRNNLNFDKTLIFRYEDIYFNKIGFITKIFDYFRITVDPVILSNVALKNDIRPAEEDISKHIRKGTPGDYREKLRPETIQKLNAQFAEVGDFFGYELR